MALNDQITKSDIHHISNRSFCGLSIKDFLHLLASLVLPLILGIFTIMTANNQQKEILRQQERDSLLRQQDQNLSNINNEAQRYLAIEKYRDELLVTYIKDMGELLDRHNGTLTTNFRISALAKAKTLTVIRQLDGPRITTVILFLYEAGLITKTNQNVSLNMERAKLTGIDLNFSTTLKTNLENLCLSGALLEHSIFSKVALINCDFNFVQLDNVTFSYATLDQVYMFTDTLHSVEMSFVELKGVNLSDSVLDNVNVTSAWFKSVELLNASLKNVEFSFLTFSAVDFSHSKLENVIFSFAQLQNVNFSFAFLINVTFINSTLELGNFTGATILQTTFIKTDCITADFRHSDISQSAFLHVNAKWARFQYAELSNVDFSFSNLQNANFSNTSMTDNQLWNTLSIRDAYLPNGTFAVGRNLLTNSHASCKKSLLDFLRSNITSVVIRQNINLSDLVDITIWTHSRIILVANISNDVFIELSALNSTGEILDKQHLCSTSKSIRINLNSKNIEAFELTVKLNTLTNRSTLSSRWCDNIYLFIDYDTKSGSLPVPLRSANMSENPKWFQDGQTVAGGHLKGNGTHQLSFPYGLYVDDDETVYIADYENHRVVAWTCKAKFGEIVAGGNGRGNKTNQLNRPTDVIFDTTRDYLIICDSKNNRIVRWSRKKYSTGDTIIVNTECEGLTMDSSGILYAVNTIKYTVRRYDIEHSVERIVAGGYGNGNSLNQIGSPKYVAIDQDRSIYVSENTNHRVTKWLQNAREGIVVAGGFGPGQNTTQLSHPRGIIVDQMGTIYIADTANHRIMCWPNGSAQGNFVVGENGRGARSDQLNTPVGLAFDRHGNLYVSDAGNHRIQKFSLKLN